MLDKVESMFDEMVPMLKKIKKKNYEQRMDEFREAYGHYFQEMLEYTDAKEGKEEKEEAVGKIAEVFVEKVDKAAQVKGKINGRKQADMNFFMIYYVFPAILLTEHEWADAIADAICKRWGAVFKDSKIGYTTYDKLYDSFRNKIFGIF